VRAKRRRNLFAPIALAAIAGLLLADPAAARSALVLPYPPSIGSIPAATYDDNGNRLGDAELTYRRKENGNLLLRAVTSVRAGARNMIEAEFAEIGDGSGLRVLWERSQSHDELGNPMTVVHVDHERGRASCTPPNEEGATEVVELPKDDRVANTVMSLLFLPIVRGEKSDLHYQSFLCRGGARFMDFVAKRDDDASGNVIEVSFGPDLGFVFSAFAKLVVPKLRFWFDADKQGDYLAHRMPLYGGGPEVVIMREGVSASGLQPLSQ
jgi:hypothetical protein